MQRRAGFGAGSGRRGEGTIEIPHDTGPGGGEGSLTRRAFLAAGGRGLASAALAASLPAAAGCGEGREGGSPPPGGLGDWAAVRRQFPLSRDHIHLAGLLLTSHPAPVREAIERHRRALDENPALYVEENDARLEREARRAAAAYLEAEPEEIALTDSTTMAIALVYAGVAVRPGQEFLTTTQDYYSTRESLRYRAARAGVSPREIAPYRAIDSVTADEVVETIVREVRPQTRVVALTWVHSGTGLKIPVRRIADALAESNAGRAEADRALLCVDAVHALGVEDFSVRDPGCDFLMAGTHKWIFAPRGTGILWGHPRSQAQLSPTIPTFTRGEGWGGRMTPGGFKPFEHRWAMAEAFDFHREIGKERVAERIGALSRQCKEGLARMPHVRLYTPLSDDLSAGIVCFDVEGMSPAAVVRRLKERRIVASTTPYSPSHARLSPGIFNTPEEIETTLAAIHAMG